LVYEESGKPALVVSLSFDEKSICEKGQQKDICILNNLEIGDRARIVGVLEGSVLTVYDLIWLGR
jgi:hypothetical protein